MGNRKLMALVGGVVVVLIAFSFYAPLTGAASNLYLQFVESCRLGSDSVLTLRGQETIDSDDVGLLTVGKIGVASTDWIATLTAMIQTDCGISAGSRPAAWAVSNWVDANGDPAGTAAYRPPQGTSKPLWFGDGTRATWFNSSGANGDWLIIDMYTEDGSMVELGVRIVGNPPAWEDNKPLRLASGLTPGVWEAPVGITTRFSGINKLLISLLPLLLVISFLASAWGALYAYAGSADGGIKDAISWEVMTLVALMIAVFLAPVFLEFAQDASYVASSGAYQSTQRFSAIINLLFTLMPLAFTIGVIGIAVQRGYRTVQNIRGS